MPNLTEAEKQEVLRCLEADKPLPDKYRFLLFDDKREVELVWNGKTSEVTNVVLPFQTIECVDEPRLEAAEGPRAGRDTELLFSLDERGRQLRGWTNKLIWGDNKLILSSLKNGPLREEIERQGGLKLIYIDPPFDVGADFSMDIEVGGDADGKGGDTFTKRPNILEEIAYRDTWGRGADSFIAMIYERLILMRDLLAEDGSIYVHCDGRVNSHIRLAMDEVFGSNALANQVSWKRTSSHGGADRYGNITDTLLFYTKGDNHTWNTVYQKSTDEHMERHYRHEDVRGKFALGEMTGPGIRRGPTGDVWRGFDVTKLGRHWAVPPTAMDDLDNQGLIYWPKKEGGWPRLKRYLADYKGRPGTDFWDDISPINMMADERIDYPTQKPETLVERVLTASSNPGDLVADFFVGSGTTAAVAEKLGRKWIATDLGKFAIHTTRKRMIGVQRQLQKEGKDYRAFELLNLGRYERQHFVGVNPNLREEEKAKQLAAKEAAFLGLILRAYKAEAVEGYPAFHGKKNGRLVAVGPVNLPVTRLFVEEIIVECRKKKATKVDLLGFEFEMGLFPNVLEEAKAKGIDIAPKYIPAEVFDKRAVEKDQVVFHDVAYIEVDVVQKKGSVAVRLKDFSVFYSQDSVKQAEEGLAKGKKGGSKIVVDNGKIVKVTRDAKGKVTRETLTEKWSDWVDYWAVDFDYENKRELIRVEKPLQIEDQGELLETKQQSALREWEEVWTGEYVFENEWQSFRTKKDRSLELECPPHELRTDKPKVKVAVKVVDIFGNDTMTIVEVAVGKGSASKASAKGGK